MVADDAKTSINKLRSKTTSRSGMLCARMYMDDKYWAMIIIKML